MFRVATCISREQMFTLQQKSHPFMAVLNTASRLIINNLDKQLNLSLFKSKKPTLDLTRMFVLPVNV